MRLEQPGEKFTAAGIGRVGEAHGLVERDLLVVPVRHVARGDAEAVCGAKFARSQVDVSSWELYEEQSAVECGIATSTSWTGELTARARRCGMANGRTCGSAERCRGAIGRSSGW